MASLHEFIPQATRKESAQLAQALLPGEELLWAVRPVPMLRMTDALISLLMGLPASAVVAGILWTALGCPGAWGEIQLPVGLRPWLGMAVLLLFALLALWLLLLPWLRKRAMRHSVYALTNRRALVMERGWVEPYALRAELLHERRQGRGGRGDLIFGSRKNHDATEDVGFLNVPDILRAEEAFYTALEKARDSGRTPGAAGRE